MRSSKAEVKYPLVKVNRFGREEIYCADAAVTGWGDNRNSYTNKFCSLLSEKLNAKRAILTSSFHGALHLVVKTLELGSQHEIIAPNLSWVGTVNPFVWHGCKIRFCDVRRDNSLGQTKSIENLINRKTKAIIFVHNLGNVADLKYLRNLCDEKDIWLIEDCAPAFGGKVFNKSVGNQGHFGLFSFNATKIITTGGEGGAVICDNEHLMEKIRCISTQGRDLNSQFGYKINKVGLKYNITNLQCAFGLAQLENLDLILDRKKKIFDKYLNTFQVNSDFKMLYSRNIGCSNTYWLPTVSFGKKINLNLLIELLSQRGIDSRPFFTPLSDLGIYANNRFNTPNAIQLASNCLSMPSYVDLQDSEVEYIAKSVCEIAFTLIN